MGRKLDVTDLVGAVEIAKRLGLSAPQVVYTWRKRYDDFPEPVATLAMGAVWAWQDVAAWAKRTGRLDTAKHGLKEVMAENMQQLMKPRDFKRR